MPAAEDESAASRASYAPSSNIGGMWFVNSVGPSMYIIDLMSIGTTEVADSSDDV